MKKLFCLFTAISLLALPACGGSVTLGKDFGISAEKTTYKTDAPKGILAVLPPAGYETAAQNEYLMLCFDEKTANIAVIDKRGGEIYLSNPEKSGANLTTAARSQLFITTCTSNSTVVNYDTAKDSVDKGQMTYSIKDGLTVTYVLGSAGRDTSRLPHKLSDERFNELSKRADAAGKTLLQRRYSQNGEGIWEIREGMTENMVEKLTEVFDLIGYTAEELAADNAEHGLAAQSAESMTYTIPVSYRLEEDSLKVSINCKDIKYPSSAPITQIKVLEFFGAMKAGEPGYIMVPDGSGALIEPKNVQSNMPAFSQPVYGQDMTLPVDAGNNTLQKILMPVFGVNRVAGGFLTVIEDGDALASIEAYRPGAVHDFAAAYASYKVTASQDVGLESDSISKYIEFQDGIYSGEFCQRYIFLSGNSDYNAMAAVYRAYLGISYGNLGDEMPFMLETLGSATASASTLGFIHDRDIVLTSANDNINIINSLSENGVSNINLRYVGALRGGIDQKLIKGLSFIDGIGDLQEIKSLEERLKSLGGGLYIDAKLQTLSAKDGSADKNSMSAMNMANRQSRIYDFDLVTGNIASGTRNDYRVIASPAAVRGIAENLRSGMQGKGLDGLSIADISSTSYSDYKSGRQILRPYAIRNSAEAIKDLKQSGLRLMLATPNVTTAAYSSLYSRVPLSGSSMVQEACSIPFYQLVYHGAALYSGEPMNYSVNIEQSILRSIEYGAAPCFMFVADSEKVSNEPFYSYLYAARADKWLDAAADAYNRMAEILSSVQNSVMTEHRTLESGVVRVVYDNGKAVYINYNSVTKTADSIALQPMSAKLAEVAQ